VIGKHTKLLLHYCIFKNLLHWNTGLLINHPSSWPVVITMKKKLAGTWKKNIGYWLVQMNGTRFATAQILEKPVEVVKGRILAGWAQKSPKPWSSFGVLNLKQQKYRTSHTILESARVPSLCGSVTLKYNRGDKVQHPLTLLSTVSNKMDCRSLNLGRCG
jgi:hypothetical protein